MPRRRKSVLASILATGVCLSGMGWTPVPLRAQPAAEEWEITPESEAAIAKGLEFLAGRQGPTGSWGMNELGLVATGAMAFMAAGHTPGDARYGETVERALEYVMANAKPSGLLNASEPHHDMYNHGLATFVLGQAYGMTNDRQCGAALDKALRVIVQTQGPDGGWAYEARPADGDLSLCVMQAKALRSATDSGFEIPRRTIEKAVERVRAMYFPQHGMKNQGDAKLREGPGQFTYYGVGGGNTPAMAAAGVVCLQEFGRYDDWRIPKSMERVTAEIAAAPAPAPGSGVLPFDAYTLNYVGQSLYQVGGQGWKDHYPKLRDDVIKGQRADGGWTAGRHVGGLAGDVYGTAVAVFVLAIPYRYLPILQEAKVGVLADR